MKIDIEKTFEGLPRVAWQESALSLNKGFLLSFILAFVMVVFVLMGTSNKEIKSSSDLGSFLVIALFSTAVLWIYVYSRRPVQRVHTSAARSCWVENRGGRLFFCTDFKDSEISLSHTQSRDMPLDNLANFMLGTENEWLLSATERRDKTESTDQTVIFAVGEDNSRILVACNNFSKSDNADLHVALTRTFIINRGNYA